ncbi:MAG: ATP-grasp domain-containing protein [Polyangiales bacterium]
MNGATSSKLLVVGCGFPQLSLIRLARSLDVHVVGVDLNRHAVGVPYVSEFHEVSTNDVEGIEATVKRSGARAITTTGSEVSLKAVALVAARLGLPFHADPEVIRRCQEKDAMRAGYEAGGVSVPRFASCGTIDQARTFAREVGFPIVLKPSRGWGQRGVARVDDESEIADAFAGAFEQSSSAGLAVVVAEEWLEGREYSVNGWIEDGVLVNYCVTERITVPGKKPLGVMVAEVYASGLTREEEARVVEEARRGARALGHRRGPCYSQVMLERPLAASASRERKCVLFETAARMGGGFDADVTKLASGVDLYKRILGVAFDRLDWEREGVTAKSYGGAIAKFLVAKPGVVRAIDGIEAARAVADVDDVQVFTHVGGTVHPLTDSAKRAAYALAHGVDRASAERAADAALAAIRIDT